MHVCMVIFEPFLQCFHSRNMHKLKCKIWIKKLILMNKLTNKKNIFCDDDDHYSHTNISILIFHHFSLYRSSECDVIRGECTQTYVPYLFLVIPLGPVTLTGQDYVLVESGCVCKPKYAVDSPSETKVTP